MKTVVIILCSLNVITSQDVFSRDKLNNSISKLEITNSLPAEKCVNQLKLLDESLNDESVSWASDSEFKF